MCVCVYVCIYMCVYQSMIYIYIYIYVCVYVYMCVYQVLKDPVFEAMMNVRRLGSTDFMNLLNDCFPKSVISYFKLKRTLLLLNLIFNPSKIFFCFKL